MKKLVAFLFSFLITVSAFAGQEQFGVLKVPSDSLVRFIRKEFGSKVYFLKDVEDVQSFTVRTERSLFVDAAFKALTEAGYTVTEYDGCSFILSKRGFSTSLPTDYFENLQKGGDTDDSLLKYLDDANTVVTFQNKIYEIGDPSRIREGKATVSGYVRDINTGEPLVGVSLYSETGSAYAQTDAYGFYKIVLPVGETTLGLSGYSLEDMKLNLVVYEDGGLDVVMKEKVFSLTGAVITSESSTRHRTPQMGVEKIRVDAIKNVPAVFGEADVLKVVMTLPGVKSVGEAASGYNVRGGSVDQNLILFNEGTIYNPSHMFGILSAFNTDVISDIELYKSSIPAEYGGRISSVLEVRSRDGNSRKVTGSVGVGLLTSRLHLEGPIVKDRTTFNFGARTTYSNWILKLLPQESGYSGGSAGFQDYNLGLSHKFNQNNSIHAYGYYSQDNFRFTNNNAYGFRNMNGSIKWRSNFSERHSLELSAGYDDYRYSIEDASDENSAYSLSSDIGQYSARLKFKSLAGERHTLTYGVSSVWYDLKPGIYSPLKESINVKPDSLDIQNAVEGAFHLSDTWIVSDRVSLDLGVRYSMFLPSDALKKWGGPEIRLSGKYSISDNISLKAGYNTMRQYIHMISNNTTISPTDTWMLSSDKVHPQDGWQAASGLYASAFHNTVDLSVEGYFKKTNHSVDYQSGAQLSMNPNLADELIDTEGEAYGVEFMAKKNTGKLNGWVSYTYSRSFLRETEDRGIATINGGDWYNASYDKPHDLKVVANYKFTHRYSVSANVDYSSGRPVTIPVGKYEYAGGTRLVYSERNGYRIPDYFRLDLALIIEPGHYLKKLTHMSFTFGCYNVTGRKNPYSIYYTTEGGQNVTGHMLSVFATQVPYVNFDIKF